MLDGPHPVPSKSRPSAAGARVSYGEALSWLLQRWVLIAGVSCVCALLAYGASLFIPPSFVATATLFIDSRSLQPLADTSGQAASSDNNFEVSFVESQARIVTSRSVLSRVVAAQGLADDPAFGGGGGSSAMDRLKGLLGVAPRAPASTEGQRLAALVALADRVTVRRPERTFIMDVSVRAPSPETAARLANAVVQAYFEEQSTANATKARRANDALTSRLDQLRDRVRQSQERAQAFKEQHGLVGTRLQLSSEQQLTDANAQLAQARTRRVQSRVHLDELTPSEAGQGAAGDTPEAVASPTIALLRSKQADVKRQLGSILTQLGPRHPAVRDARDQLASIDQSIQGELSHIRQAAQLDYQRAVAAETASQAIVDRLSKEASDTSSALAQWTQLQQEVDINQNLLNTFLSRSREMGEIEQLDTSTARVISTAEPPLNRTFPPRGIVFFVVGAVLGFWLAVARILMEKTRILSLRRRRGLAPGDRDGPPAEDGAARPRILASDGRRP